jgi:predicted nicotinamide N-methyase
MGLTGAVAAALGAHVVLADLATPALLLARLNTLDFADRTAVRKLNWQTARLGRRFDLILGADILYERAQWEYLDRFWRQHLAPGGTVLLGEPGRQTGDAFPAWIVERGWVVTQGRENVPTRKEPVRLYALTF